MNKNMTSLLRLSEKPVLRIIGLMSGTSLDGLDIALCEIGGSGADARVDLKHFTTIDYPLTVKQAIREVFAREEILLQDLCLLNPWIGRLHAEYVLQVLRRWGYTAGDIDIIASHGQTVYHGPKKFHRRDAFPDSTLQIGDGDHIAVGTGILTMSDFRQKHIAAGGEGAPLVIYGDYYLFSRKGENRVMLNMGGIANFSFLPGSGQMSELAVGDTGPGNTLLDAYMQIHFGREFDLDAAVASRGTVHEGLLNALKNDPFFELPFPKTTGPELFNLDYLRLAQQRSGSGELASEDVMATLTQFSADTVTDALLRLPVAPETLVVYASGGGAGNPLLMRLIHERLPQASIYKSDELGIPAEAKEAILFAVLANETLKGEPAVLASAGMPAVTLGKLSFPG